MPSPSPHSTRTDQAPQAPSRAKAAPAHSNRTATASPSLLPHRPSTARPTHALAASAHSNRTITVPLSLRLPNNHRGSHPTLWPHPPQPSRAVGLPAPDRTTRLCGPRPFAKNRCAARVNPPHRIPAYLPNQPPAGQEQPTAP
ncbi:hypothetical protein GCM10027360_27000 [Amycolatopsis echigonensis]